MFWSSPVGMIVIFLLVIGMLYAVYGLFDPTLGASKSVRRRLDRIVDGKSRRADGKKQPSAVDIMGVQKKGLIANLILPMIPRRDKLRARLARTGRPIEMGKYLMINAALVVVGFFLGLAFFKQPPAVSLFIGIIIGLGLPHKYIGRLIAKRNKMFLSQFPDAIDLVVRGVRSGLPIGESIKSIAKEMPAPISEEFSKVNDSMKLGQTVEKALWECSARLDMPEVKFFVIALSIQRETGGNLAETLDNLSQILRKRRFMQLKIKAMSSEARASAMIIGSLPFIMFGILMLMNPKYVGLLLSDPRGHVLVGIGLGLIFLGNFIMRKMASFKI